MRVKKLSKSNDKLNCSFSLVIIVALLFILGIPAGALALTKPILVSPGNYSSITSTSYTFTWSHPYYDEYELKIKTSGGTLKYASGRITSKSKTVNLAGAALSPGSTYKWYVVVYALGQEDSSADRWFTYNPTMPGSVSVSPTSGTWTSTPKYVNVSSSYAGRIYYTIRTTTDGSTPADPPVPTTTLNDGSITGSSGTFQVYASAGQNKKLKVRFRGYNNAGYGPTTGSYLYSINLATAADDHGNSCSSATAMALNSSKAGAIGTAGDYDYFKVIAPSAGTLTAYTTGTTDTYGYLKNSSCANIKYDDDTGEGANFSFTPTTVAAGTYYIAVRHYYTSTGVGPYTLRVNFTPSAPVVTDDHGNSCSTATTMALNSSKAGTIGTGGDYDYFKVTVPSTGTLNAYSTGTTDTYGYLKNSSCVNIKYDDDAGDGSNFSFTPTTVSAGTYFIAVRHYYSSTGTGPYTLRVNFGTIPGSVSVSPTSGTWTSYPKYVNISSSYASRIYYTIRTTTDGSTPVDPPVPTTTVNDGSITGSSGTFQVYTSAGQNRKLKVRFRGYNSAGYGPTTGSYLYTINLSPTNPTNPFAAGTDAFVNGNNGVCVDMDGFYGCQCVDLMRSFFQQVLKVPSPSSSGSAYSIYAGVSGSITLTSGTRKVRLDKIANTPTGVPLKGDIVFWSTAVGSGYGHVAIFLSGDASSFISFDQNWPSGNLTIGSPAAKVTHNYNNVVGWLHPVLLSN